MPNDVSAFEKTVATLGDGEYVFRLYVTGLTPRSERAIANIREICEEFLQGRYTLTVFDLLDNPEVAKNEQIIAAPTLVKQLPPPLRRLVGDLSQRERVLVVLDLPAADAP